MRVHGTQNLNIEKFNLNICTSNWDANLNKVRVFIPYKRFGCTQQARNSGIQYSSLFSSINLNRSLHVLLASPMIAVKVFLVVVLEDGVEVLVLMRGEVGAEVWVEGETGL